MTRPLASGVAARVRRIPAQSNIERAAKHLQWWHEQAAKEMERFHSRTALWWRHVDRTTVEHFASRFDVLVAEKMAIIKELPLHNRSHSRRQK